MLSTVVAEKRYLTRKIISQNSFQHLSPLRICCRCIGYRICIDLIEGKKPLSPMCATHWQDDGSSSSRAACRSIRLTGLNRGGPRQAETRTSCVGGFTMMRGWGSGSRTRSEIGKVCLVSRRRRRRRLPCTDTVIIPARNRQVRGSLVWLCPSVLHSYVFESWDAWLSIKVGTTWNLLPVGPGL